MQGDQTKRQRLEDSSDVDLGVAGGADVKSTQAKIGEFLHKLKDLATRRERSRRVWTFVEHIQDNENSALSHLRRLGLGPVAHSQSRRWCRGMAWEGMRA
jgi:hypothetical protein